MVVVYQEKSVSFGGGGGLVLPVPSPFSFQHIQVSVAFLGDRRPWSVSEIQGAQLALSANFVL